MSGKELITAGFIETDLFKQSLHAIDYIFLEEKVPFLQKALLLPKVRLLGEYLVH